MERTDERSGEAKRPKDMKPRVYWLGSPPDKCETCAKAFAEVFFDAKTRMGYWAKICQRCMGQYGLGLGTGLGQKYRKQTDGSWLKVQG